MDLALRADADEVRIPAGLLDLAGDLRVPMGARGLVVFVHGGGCSRKSPRNHELARRLAGAGLATLLVDLLTREEVERARRVGSWNADAGFLAERLALVSEHVARRAATRGLHLGYFGAGTGAAAAMLAAADRPELVGAIMSRGGRVELAGVALEKVLAPTLLVVGADDHPLRELNERAFQRLRCEKRLRIAPRATQLFEAPGALEAVAGLATAWFAWFLRDEVAPGRSGVPPALHLA